MQIIINNGINGELVAGGIVDDDLKEMGIENRFHRKVVLNAFQKLTHSTKNEGL